MNKKYKRKYQIDINWQTRHKNLRTPNVRRLIQNILSNETGTSHQISLLFCDDETIKSLNLKFRDINNPTDVLSFAVSDSDTNFLGDIALSLTTAEHQAKGNNISFEAEFKRLLIHGILHLFGYDHEDGHIKRRIMQDREKQLFQEVGHLPLC